MKKRFLFILLFFLICGLFVAVFYPLLTSGSVENSWHTKASMNQARAGLGVAVVDGKIYALGGYTTYDSVPADCVGTNERYDPKTDTWITLKPMPTPRMSFVIAAYEGKIYCMGGYNRNDGNTVATSFKVNEVYDTVTDSWSTKADIPFFGSAQTHVVDGKIFVTHGYGDALFMYDPVTDVWTQKTSIPYSGQGRVSAVVDSKIVFSFGYYPNNMAPGKPIEIVMIYDTKTDTYSEGSIPPKGYTSGVSTAIATTGVYAPQRIYMLGTKNGGIFNSNTVYDPINDTWLTAKALPTFQGNFGTAVVDDVIYVIGGQRRELGLLEFILPSKTFSTNQQYIPVGYFGSVSTAEPLLNYYIIAGLTIAIGVATCSLFVISKKEKSKKRLIKMS
ncbi:MAG: hypothetical protein FWG55_06625 [Candidatus Bathyarchaeota archaeon]|nr:hypothetical protein [Candidatus Termiticorpusculum sp.]